MKVVRVPAVEHVRFPTPADGARFLQFAERVEPCYRHRVSEQLQPHIILAPELGKQLGESLRHGEVTGDGAARVWAGSFSNAAPGHAAQFALDLLLGASGDTVLLATLLQYLPTRDPGVVSILAPQEAKLTAVLLGATPEVGRDAWFALTAIAEFSPVAANALQQAVAR